MVTPFLNVYSYPLFVIKCLRGFRSMQNSSRDSASPWYIPPFMVMCAMASELVSRVVLNSYAEFLMNLVSALLVLYSAKHSSIIVWGIES